MNYQWCPLGAFALVCAANGALAQEAQPAFSWSAGALATTRLNPSESFDHVENELELFVAAEFGQGFHSGLTLTSLYNDPADNFEYEFTLGYGAEFANGLSWDLTYGYIGLEDTAGHSEEITGTLGFALGASVDSSFAVILDPDTGLSDQEFGAETALTDQWTLFGLVGNSDRDDNVYGEIGLGYALTDQVAFEVLYEDTNDGDPLLGFTVGYTFSR